MELSKNIHPSTEPEGRYNLDLVVSFEQYRSEMDKYSSLMRIGPETEEAYSYILNSASVVIGQSVTGLYVPISASNSDSNTFSNDVVEDKTQIGLAPKAFIDRKEVFPDVYFPVQQTLSSKTVSEIVNGGPKLFDNITNEVSENSGELLAQTGLPEYMLFSQYDFSEFSQQLKTSSPSDTRVGDGLVVTADRNKIVRFMDSIKELQVSAFNAQTIQTGYFGGLSETDLESFIYDDNFIPIMGYDDTSSEVLSITLFSPDFSDYDSIKWINPRAVKKLTGLGDGIGVSTLTLPLITTSKMGGLGLMKHAVIKAIEETVYKTQCDRVSVLYQCNGLSIGFTPKIIHSAVMSLGGIHYETVAESTTYSR